MSISALSELAIKVVADMPTYPPENVVLDKLRWAWEKLLDQSELWREDLTSIDAVEDQADYTLTPSAGVIIRVIEVKLNDNVVSEEGYRMVDTQTLRFEENFVPSEDSTDGIDVEVAISPDINGTTGPSWILNRFYEGMVHGARFALYKMIGKPWSDADPLKQATTLEKALFDAEIAEAITARRDHRTTRSTGFRAFSRTKNR